MRIAVLILLCSMPVILSADPPRPSSYSSSLTAADHYRAAIVAYQNGDSKQLAIDAKAALAKRPGSPQLVYLNAVAEVANGNLESSLDYLSVLADQGLVISPDREPAFSDYKSDLRFAALTQQFQNNNEPLGQASVRASLPDKEFIPEGIAVDGESSDLYLGSIRQQKIIVIDQLQQTRRFADSGSSALLSAFGMRLDKPRQRLLVATSGVREAAEISSQKLGRAGILSFDLKTGKQLGQWWLPDDPDGHVLGDLVVTAAGIVFTSDSIGGGIYQLHTGSGRFSSLVQPGRFVSPQGVALTKDEKGLYIAAYRGGLYYLDIESKRLDEIDYSATTTHGIDGLYRSGGSLIAIQNGQRPHRVVQFKLSESGRGIIGHQVLASNLEQFDEPTLGALDKDKFHYIANSHWPAFDAEGNLSDADLTGPLVLTIPVSD